MVVWELTGITASPQPIDCLYHFHTDTWPTFNFLIGDVLCWENGGSLTVYECAPAGDVATLCADSPAGAGSDDWTDLGLTLSEVSF